MSFKKRLVNSADTFESHIRFCCLKQHCARRETDRLLFPGLPIDKSIGDTCKLYDNVP